MDTPVLPARQLPFSQIRVSRLRGENSRHREGLFEITAGYRKDSRNSLDSNHKRRGASGGGKVEQEKYAADATVTGKFRGRQIAGMGIKFPGVVDFLRCG